MAINKNASITYGRSRIENRLTHLNIRGVRKKTTIRRQFWWMREPFENAPFEKAELTKSATWLTAAKP